MLIFIIWHRIYYYKRCDPYRMTLIMDHLLDHHKIETMFGEYILMTSLREQDNHERIKDLIKHKIRI
mgnify:CR=1 FL=1